MGGGTCLSSLGGCTIAGMPRGLSTLNARRANPILKTPRGCLLCQHYEGSSLMHRFFVFNHMEGSLTGFFILLSIIHLKHSSLCIPFFIQQTVLEHLAWTRHWAREKEAKHLGGWGCMLRSHTTCLRGTPALPLSKGTQGKCPHSISTHLSHL